MKQTVQINIQGHEFSLKTDLPVAQVEEVASFVNAQIEQVSGADRSVDSYRAVVLALLNVAGLYLHQEDTPGQDAATSQDSKLNRRLESLVGRIEDALRDPQGTLDF